MNKKNIGVALVSFAGLYIILDFTVLKDNFQNATLSSIVALLAVIGFILVRKNSN